MWRKHNKSVIKVQEPGYGLDDREFDSRQALGIFFFTTASSQVLEPTQPPIQWVPGAHSLGVKRPGREADRLPSSRAEVKMHGAIPPLPLYVFMAWRSFKAQGQLYLYLYVIKVFDKIFGKKRKMK
jgi:hypothetical protein